MKRASIAVTLSSSCWHTALASGCASVTLMCLVRWGDQNAPHFHKRRIHLPTCISSKVSAIKIIGFETWSTGNVFHITEFRTAKYLQVVCTFLKATGSCLRTNAERQQRHEERQVVWHRQGHVKFCTMMVSSSVTFHRQIRPTFYDLLIAATTTTNSARYYTGG